MILQLKKCLSIFVEKRMAWQRNTFRYLTPEEGRCEEHLRQSCQVPERERPSGERNSGNGF